MKVEILTYDAAWLAQFQTEQQFLGQLLSPWLAGSIEHIGSTAIPGIAAKPIIDIMAPVHSLQASTHAIDVLTTQAGYCYYPYKPDLMHWFCKPRPEFRTHHLHLVPIQSALWQERIAFRDALRNSSRLASEYEVLKRKLAREFFNDRDAYTEGKSEFVRKILSIRQA